MSQQPDDEQRRPGIGDVDPSALGVDSTDDQVRTHLDDESKVAQVSGAGPMAVDPEGTPEAPIARRTDPAEEDETSNEDRANR